MHQNHVFVVRCRTALNPEFLNMWTGGAAARRYFMVAGIQTTNLASISKRALSKLPVLLPGIEEQNAAVIRLNQAEARVAAEVANGSKLRLLKAGLAEDLLSGRVRVTNLLEPSP